VDLRRSAGKRPYPEVAYLCELVMHSKVWPIFDGWCAARNVDHDELAWDRWLNLVYYFATRNMTAEDRTKLDDEMAQRVAAWSLVKAKPIIAAARANPEPKNGRPQRRMPPRPASWGSDTANTFNSKSAIKTLTAGGVSGKKRR